MQRLTVFSLLLCLCAGTALAADWPSWRGVNSDGLSPDQNLPGEWSPDGENLLWKAPIGSRATPIVTRGKVCVIRLAEPLHNSGYGRYLLSVLEEG